MIYYAAVLKAVWHIRFTIYRTKAVCRKRSCRQVEPFFHFIPASSAKGICWFGSRDSAPQPIWTNILSRWEQHLRYSCLFVSSFSLAVCGYSSHCICSYGRMSYLWVTFLSISNWQWVIDRPFLDWVGYKGFFAILAMSLAWLVAIWVTYEYDFFYIFIHWHCGLRLLLSNKREFVHGYFLIFIGVFWIGDIRNCWFQDFY